MQELHAQKLTKRQAGKRNKMLQAASVLFFRHGYSGLNLDKVIQEVGGSKSSLYSYFGGKEGLFEAVIEDLRDRGSELNRTALGNILADDLRFDQYEQFLTEYGEGLLNTLTGKEYAQLNHLIVSSRHVFPELAATYYENGPQMAEKILEGFFEKLHGNRILDIPHPRLSAAGFMGSIRANHIWHRLYVEDIPPMPEEEVKEHVRECVKRFSLAHKRSKRPVSRL